MLNKVIRIGKQLAEDAYSVCFNRAYGRLIMLHRIGPVESERLSCVGELRVSVDRLQRFVDNNRKSCDFISLDEVYERFLDPSKRKRPFVCFTFDDGFRDNLEYGLPFFERNQIPFAVFITTEFINRHPAFNYPFILELIIRNNDMLHVEGRNYECLSVGQKNKTFGELKNVVLDQPYKGFENRFEDMFAEYLNPFYREDLTMTWDEVGALADSPLCTIGSHTVSHCRLSNLTDEELRCELGESRRQIEDHVGKPCEYVSYPFGWTTDVNESVRRITKEVGYKMGLVSHGGEIRKNDKDLFNVKRIMLIEND
jgi:peptidoglycan/xylan/chitin deacetylase (PgdA/CDA1 family)